ncbi:hypothetical protein K239x_43120 [Planctomycetes bacterium K23_9]|uniref:Uncharacterized protein n=1 Tax=Stieleria marina TaxID=1930275 RepID=A0A517NYY0_9BACT|nr:hypothetical protein K239x_43120 [Planctomycetes bacterium K23_9]
MKIIFLLGRHFTATNGKLNPRRCVIDGLFFGKDCSAQTITSHCWHVLRCLQVVSSSIFFSAAKGHAHV